MLDIPSSSRRRRKKRASFDDPMSMERSLEKSVNTYQQQIEASGETPEEPKGRKKSFIENLIDILNFFPRIGARAYGKATSIPGSEEFSGWQDVIKSYKPLEGVNVAMPGAKAGVGSAGKVQAEPVIEFLGGLLLDIGLDPVTYLTGGVGKGPKLFKLGKTALGEVLDIAAKKIPASEVADAMNFLGHTGPEAEQALRKMMVTAKGSPYVAEAERELSKLGQKILPGWEEITLNKQGANRLSNLIRGGADRATAEKTILSEIEQGAKLFDPGGLKFFGQSLIPGKAFKSAGEAIRPSYEGLKATPVIGWPFRAAEGVAKAITPGFGVPKELHMLRRGMETEKRYQQDLIQQTGKEWVGGLSPFQKADEILSLPERTTLGKVFREYGSQAYADAKELTKELAFRGKVMGADELAAKLAKVDPVRRREAFLAFTHSQIDSMPEQKRDIINYILEDFEKMAKKEAELGIKHGYIPEYLPQIYEQELRGAGKVGRGVTEMGAASIGGKQMGRQPFWSFSRNLTPEQAAQIGLKPVDDLAFLWAHRRMSHVQTVAEKDLYEKVLERFGIPIRKDVPFMQGMKKIFSPLAKMKDETGKIVPMGARWVPNEVADYMGALSNISKNPRAMEEIYTMYMKGLGAWKFWATVANPGFHVRNLISDMTNMWIMGMNPQGVAALTPDAIKLLRLKMPATTERMAGAALPHVPFNTKFGQYNLYEIKDYMKRNGTLDESIVTEDIDHILNLGKKYGTLNMLKAPANLAQNMSRALTQYTRSLFMLDRLARGDSLEAASWATKKALFDYSDITEFGRRTGKAIIPFYTWLTKNTALQLEQMILQPGKYSFLAHVHSNVAGQAPQLTEEEKKWIPTYFHGLAAVPTPMYGTNGSSLWWNPNIGPVDVNRLFDAKDWVSALTPAKVAVEYYFNMDWYRQRKIEDFGRFWQRAPFYMYWLPDETKQAIGMTPARDQKTGEPIWMVKGKYRFLMEEINPFLKSVGRIVQPGPDEERFWKDGLSTRATGWMLGVKLMPFDKEREKIQYLLDQRRTLQEQANAIKQKEENQ